MAYDCIPRSLSQAFYVYGKFVARHPLPFLLIPLIVAMALMVGLMNMETISDAEYLYAPTGSRSKDERKYFQNTFPYDDANHFSALRLTTIAGFIQVHIQDKSSRNVLNDDAVESIREINEFILSHKATYKGNKYNYSDLCATWEGSCVYSGFVGIVEAAGTTIDNIDISYPFHEIVSTGTVLNLISQIGDPKVNNGIVQSARAVQLGYFVRMQDSSYEKRSIAWMDSIRDELLKYPDSQVEVAFQTSLSLEQELEDSVSSIVPLFAIAYTVLATFSIASCMMFDWVRSKPWVAMGGMCAAGLGIISSMGLMSAAGVKFASVVGTMPFLIIGIGLDDMFILVSAWRYTSFKLSTEERLGQTLKSAAVSITITSVTDALAFGVGCLTPFRSVTIFCAYTGVAVSFVYVYMITFTAACMAYSGRREEANRHAFACLKVLPKKDAESTKSKSYQICCASGSIETESEPAEMTSDINQKQPLPPIGQSVANGDSHPPVSDIGDEVLLAEGIQLPWLNRFLGTTYANFIMRKPVKIVILLVYFALIGVAIYGIIDLEEGLDRSNLAPDSSYFREYFDKYQRDFLGNYGPVVMVSIDEPLDYSRRSVRNDIADLIKEFRESKYFVSDPRFVINWLDRFENYLNQTGEDINDIPSMTDFISKIRGGFFNVTAYQYHSLDIIFNDQDTAIKSSRFFMQSKALADAVDEQNSMLDARQIADDSKFNIKVFAPPFIFFDQYAVVAINTLQNLGIAVASMMVVSIILIPSLTTVVWVTLATISICSCIVGYMSHWDVSLDSVSMINLVMCIGFSVDFAAHISYHFVVSESKDPNQRARDALGYLGTPIVQGAVSTILAVLVLATSDTYIFRTFFKLVFLVMVFGFFHAMFLLPVLLSTLSCRQCKKSSDEEPPTVVKAGEDNTAYYT